MAKKYIIELEEPEMFDDRKFYTCTQMPWWAVSENIVENLTPYTEPDLEQVRKEAYDRGYDDAKGGYENGFENGMIVAWDAARKIGNMPYGEEEKVFGSGGWAFIEKHTAAEAIEKLKAYEQEKDAEIKVGDEVNAPFGKAIVVNIDSNAKKIWFIYAGGHIGFDFFKNTPTKTGRHFPEIAAVLEKMKEGQE